LCTEMDRRCRQWTNAHARSVAAAGGDEQTIARIDYDDDVTARARAGARVRRRSAQLRCLARNCVV
jgi:hypothetical protein